MAAAPDGQWPPLSTAINKACKTIWNIPKTCMSGASWLAARKASTEPKNEQASGEKHSFTARATDGHATK